MSLVELTDPEDPRLADYRSLTDLALRTRFEPPNGLFIAEGELILRRALAAGYRLRSVLIDAKRVSQLDDLPAGLPDVAIYAGSPEVLQAITGFHVHRGVLASVHRPVESTPEQVLAGAGHVVVLEDINNHTNIGAIFRSVAATGADAVLLSPTCADPLYRRSVRVSMGQVFVLPYARLQPWPQGLDWLREQGFTVLAMTPNQASIDVQRVDPALRRRCAVLLGAEGPGLSKQALQRSDAAVAIPMARGVDSLNVAASAALACWELRGRDS